MEKKIVIIRLDIKWLSIVYFRKDEILRINCPKLQKVMSTLQGCNRSRDLQSWGFFCFETSTLKRRHRPWEIRKLLTCYLWHHSPDQALSKCLELVLHRFRHSELIKKYLWNTNKDSNNRIDNDFLNHDFSW